MKNEIDFAKLRADVDKCKKMIDSSSSDEIFNFLGKLYYKYHSDIKDLHISAKPQPYLNKEEEARLDLRLAKEDLADYINCIEAFLELNTKQ